MKRIWKYMLITCIWTCMTIISNAQINKGIIGINGLTCSQCAKSVYNRLVKLPFIHEIDVDLNNTAATLTFKRGMQVDFDALAQAVKKAGYSVRFMHFALQAEAASLTSATEWCGIRYCLIFDKDISTDETIYFQLLGKQYQEVVTGDVLKQAQANGNRKKYPVKLIDKL